MLRFRVFALASVISWSLLVGAASAPPFARAVDARIQLAAYLDGVPIPLADVSSYFCDDFAYPVIRCSLSPLVQGARSTVLALLTSVEYVTVYDQASFAGTSMNVSQDYNSLLLIGWNDRISSFRGRNLETGTFFVDWFYGGSQWSFCCNTQQSTLGGYNNTFSSIKRT